MSTQPFSPQGNTVAITSAATSTAAVQVPNSQGATGLGPAQYLFVCIGAVPVFVHAEPVQNVGAVAAAVAAVNGTPGNTFVIPASTSKVLTLTPGAYFTTIATATTSTLYVTPGDGL